MLSAPSWSRQLKDAGFTIPASTSTYWVGEAMHKTGYSQLKDAQGTAQATQMLAATVAHLAGVLKARGYPALKE